YGGDFTIKSGGPSGSAKVHARSFGHLRGAGMSLGSPIGAPASTQRRIVSISSSDSDRSFLNCWMPTVLSMCHGGICRAATRARIARAHGRTASYVMSDIGAIESGRWHASHFAWKIGAISLVNVTGCAAGCAGAAAGNITGRLRTATNADVTPNPADIFQAMMPPS